MSKRVRSSLRAANKGRALRPKNFSGRVSAPPPEPNSPEQALLRLGEESPVSEAPPSSDAALSSAVASSEAVGASAEKPATTPDPLPPANASFKREAAPSLETAVAAAAAAVDTDAARHDAAIMAPAVVVAMPAPAEAPRMSEKALDAAPQRPADEPAAAAEEAPPALAVVEAVVAKTEPAVEKPQPAPERAEAVVAKDKASPAKVEAEVAKIEPAPASVRPRKAEEDLDASSVSAEFFRDEEESIAPLVEADDLPEELPGRVVLSPATVARRARFRRVVASVVAFAGVISLAVIGKSIAAPRHNASAARVAVAAAVAPPRAEPAPVAAPAPKPAEVAAPAPAPTETAAPAATDAKPDEAKADAAKADDKKADDAPKVDDKKTDDAAKADDKKADDKADDKKAEEAKADDKGAAPSGADAKALQKETLALLNRGKSKDAAEKAKEAIAADPDDAISYLYLGTALQDSGRWKDGVEAYCECVRHATKGSINECRQMGGHK
jgi:hypothetical protein